MVGVNPEVAHEHMSGLNLMHAVAQAWEAGKLFHIDLNDQMPGRFDLWLVQPEVGILAGFSKMLATRGRVTSTQTPTGPKTMKG